MTTTSADPKNLAEFVTNGAAGRSSLESSFATLKSLQSTVVAGCIDYYVTPKATAGADEAFAAMKANEKFVDVIHDALLTADVNSMGLPTINDADLTVALTAAGVGAPPAVVAFEPAVLMGMPPTSGFVDDPICAANGNFVEIEHDLRFPGRSAVLDVVRVYNSRGTAAVGAFGPGWSSPLDLRISAPAGGVLRVHLADGAVVPFADRGDGVLVALGSRQLEVTSTGTGWVLHEGHTKRWSFDADGLLTGGTGAAAKLVVVRDDDDHVVEMFEARSGRRVTYAWSRERVVAATASDGRSVSYRYDHDGVLVGVDRSDGGVSYVVDDRLITSVTDADGVTLARNVYDGEARVVSQTNEMGRTTQYEYSEHGTTLISDSIDGPRNAFTHDRRGNVTAVIDGLGRAMRITYDDQDRATRIVGRDGSVLEYRFDSRGNLVGRTDPDGGTAAWEWDDLDRLAVETHRNGARTTYGYDGTHRRPSWITGPDGATITIRVDDDDLPVQVVDADGVTTVLEWDDDGQLTARLDALGNRTEVHYDGAGQAVGVVDGAGSVTTLINDAAGRVVRAIIGESSTTYAYTAAGRPLSASESTGVSWSASYGDNGRVATFTDGEGSEVGFEWNVFGNLETVIAPDGGRFGHVYDPVGNLIAATDPEGNTSTVEVDAEGRVVKATDAAGRQWRRELDVLGRTVVSIAPDGARTRYEHHFDGSVAKVVHPDGTSVSTEIDVNGRVVAVIDEQRARYEFAYSPAGRLVERRWPSGRVERFRHDAAGRLVGIDSEGDRVDYTRNGRGVIVAANGSDGQVAVDLSAEGDLLGVDGPFGSQRFDLDAAGRVTGVVDGEGGRTSFERDRRGLVSAATDANGLTAAMGYDVRGRLAHTVAPNGDRTDFDYDPVGWLRSVSDPVGTMTHRVDATGRSLGHVDGNGHRVDYTLDAAGRTIGVDAQGSPTTSFAYDQRGRLTEALRIADDLRTRFAWDATGRLDRVDGPSGSLEVERDVDGLPTAWVQNDVRVSVVRDRTGKVIGLDDPIEGAVTAPARIRFERDGAGRITADERGGTYRYDEGGRLVEAVDATGVRRSFRYGADGLLEAEFEPGGQTYYRRGFLGRIESVVHADASETNFTYDGAGRRVEARHSGGRTIRYHWDDLGALVAVDQTNAEGVTRHLRIDVDAMGRPVDVGGVPVLWDDIGTGKPMQIGETRFLHLEGRSRAVGGDGAWSDPTDDPWGFERDDSPHLGFRDELSVAGLVWMGVRVYDPATREFLSPDPLLPVAGRPGYSGLYSYGFLNPVNYLDPTGMRPISQQEYDAIRTAEEQGRLGQAWEAIKDDPWGTVAMIGVTAIGVALVATGVGTAVGVGILVGVAASASFGVATGTFSPTGTAISGAFGAIPGGNTLRGAMLVGAGSGFAGSVTTDVVEGRPIDWGNASMQGVLGLGTGGVAHGITTRIGGVHPTVDAPAAPTARFEVDSHGVVTDLRPPAPQTTILGENMTGRVMPFADATGARTLGFGSTPEQWAAMTPQQRYKLNDGMLRARVNAGDDFRYIGIDPERLPADRARFDLTRSELLRLDERGVPYDVVSQDEVIATIGRK